jgi:hypothetical protein
LGFAAVYEKSIAQKGEEMMRRQAMCGVLLGAVAMVTACGSSLSSRAQGNTASNSGAQTAQVLPVATNPIHNASTATGLAVVNPMVENNVDPRNGQPAPDRLQFTIKNSSSQTVTNLETYYTMTDAVTHQAEGYYQKLTGITLGPGQGAAVFFDNGSGPGHYPENRYSIYRTSPNAVNFTIEVSVRGLAPAYAHAQKSPGTGEGPG